MLDDVTVSRHHALFTTTASGRVTVRDLNSLNGTYVNGSRVEEVTLRHVRRGADREVQAHVRRGGGPMSAKSTRTYLSIGEVLSLLRADFPDVTISKIRFLEGQGLVSPERTSSGYRKFHDPDVERLRFVLRHQREHFLPLKVISERMEEAGPRAERAATPPGARRRSVSELVAALQETPPTTAVPADASADATEAAPANRAPPTAPRSRQRSAPCRRTTRPTSPSASDRRVARSRPKRSATAGGPRCRRGRRRSSSTA